jgi:hypothetical protein
MLEIGSRVQISQNLNDDFHHKTGMIEDKIGNDYLIKFDNKKLNLIDDNYRIFSVDALYAIDDDPDFVVL